MLTSADLPPGYEVFDSPNRGETAAILTYNGKPIPHTFFIGDYPVVTMPEQAACAFAIQAENHRWSFSTHDPHHWEALCNEASMWQRIALSNLEQVAKVNPVLRGRVSDLMLVAALRGRLAEYRVAFDQLLKHTTEPALIDRALTEAMFGPDQTHSPFTAHATNRAEQLRTFFTGRWPASLTDIIPTAVEYVRSAAAAEYMQNGTDADLAAAAVGMRPASAPPASRPEMPPLRMQTGPGSLTHARGR